MPLFHIDSDKLTVRAATNFPLEKELQNLIENNLEAVFNCRFIATEFSTGSVHGGRIDTLALSEDANPVIIEYKKVKSSGLVNQSLFYLSWLKDHRGDFELAVQKVITSDAEVDWSAVQVICIAPSYEKYDLHAVQMMGANITLWRYRLFEGGELYLEPVYRPSATIIDQPHTDTAIASVKNPVMVAAGKKAAITRATGSYTIEEHLGKASDKSREIAELVRVVALGLDDSVEEAPKKFYIAYKVAQNFMCMEIRKSTVLLYLKLNPDDVEEPPSNSRDVRAIGHYGTGGFELSLRTQDDAVAAEEYIQRAFETIGG